MFFYKVSSSAQYFARLGFVKDGFHVSFLIKDRNVDSEESIVFGGYSARVDQRDQG